MKYLYDNITYIQAAQVWLCLNLSKWRWRLLTEGLRPSTRSKGCKYSLFPSRQSTECFICFLLLSILLILELNGHPVSRRQCHLDKFGHNHACAAWTYVTLSYRYFKTILTLNDVYIVTKMIYNLYLFIYQCPFKVWSDWNKIENSNELFLTIAKYCSASACAQFSKHSEDGVLISDSPPS